MQTSKKHTHKPIATVAEINRALAHLAGELDKVALLAADTGLNDIATMLRDYQTSHYKEIAK